MTTTRNLKLAKALYLARPSFSRWNLALAAALAMCIAAVSVAAEAEATVQFDIPAQDLSGALSAFTVQSCIQFLYEGDLAKNLRSTPLKGAYTPGKALQILLTGTPRPSPLHRRTNRNPGTKSHTHPTRRRSR